jgi:glycosyltransferase involved in cell wall biosynthesis
MRVLYDGYIYGSQTAGGINRYFTSLINRLPVSITPFLITYQTRERDYLDHPNLKRYTYKTFSPGHLSYRFEKRLANYYSRLEKSYLSNISVFYRIDLAHPTYYSLSTEREFSQYRCPVVLTVWDMIHEIFPEEMDPTGQRAEEKRKAILSARAIICISENTKRDLLERYPAVRDKVTVSYLASDIDASLSYGPEPVPSRPYYLYVGSRSSHKNFSGMLSAIVRAVSVRPELSLCVVGPPFNEVEKRRIVDLKLTNFVEHYGHVNDRHLAKLYRCSIALVYPSLYEGFGIPPLEAMACGTPVVVSNASSIPEVVGDAGILFDPKSSRDLADILLLLFDNPAKREALIAKGHERVKVFSWDKTVAQTLTVYRSVCD